MTKFILGLIAFIVIVLSAYIFINPKREKLDNCMTISEKERKLEVSRRPIERTVVGEKVVNISTQTPTKKYFQTTKNTQKKLSKNISNRVVEEDEMSENFVLDSIEDEDIDEEEMEHIREDIIYYQEVHAKNIELENNVD